MLNFEFNLIFFGILQVQLQDVITAKHELEQQMIEKHTKLAELSAEIEKFKDECPNTSGVLATMESDKLAASKSMTQNQELKKQLDEIQKAYIQVVRFESFFSRQIFLNFFFFSIYYYY